MALRRNKLRTILTGFAISWGIFMLIILLSAGNGLKNGVTSNFADRINNTYTIWSSATELPYKGHKAGRYIQLNNKDIQLLESLHQVTEASPIASQGGSLVFGNKSRSIYVQGVKPIYKNFEGIKVTEGRFINENDMKTKSKVIVIDVDSNDELLRGTDETTMIGKTVMFNDLSFTVVGVCKANSWGERGMGYTPFSTLQAIFNQNEYNQIVFVTKGLNTKEDNENFKAELKRKIAALHEFSPEDKRGVWIDSQMIDSLETMRIFNTINIFTHMSKAAVKPGQKVKRGQLIGYVGSTGMSSGSHLHYEVIKNGQPVNPIYYFYIDITPEEYNSLLESSKKINQALS